MKSQGKGTFYTLISSVQHMFQKNDGNEYLGGIHYHAAQPGALNLRRTKNVVFKNDNTGCQYKP